MHWTDVLSPDIPSIWDKRTSASETSNMEGLCNPQCGDLCVVAQGSNRVQLQQSGVTGTRPREEAKIRKVFVWVCGTRYGYPRQTSLKMILDRSARVAF